MIYKKIKYLLIFFILKNIFTVNSGNKIYLNEGNNEETSFSSNTDLFTGILHHASYTKTCGSFLKLPIDFMKFWMAKFQPYISKTSNLATAINYLIAEYYFEDEYLKRIDEAIISSFNYFLFSNSLNDKYNDEIEILIKKRLNLVDLTNNGTSSSVQSDLDDNFIISYGVLFEESMNLNHNKNNKKCIYVSKKSTKNRLDNTNLCSIFEKNYRNKVVKNYTKKPILKLNLNSRQILDENKELNDFICINALKRLKSNYKKIQKDLQFYLNISSNFNYTFVNIKTNYEKIMKKLMNNFEFLSSQWCGPYFECDLNMNYWALLYATPLFDINYEFKGILMIKINLTNLDINQCDDSINVYNLFSNTHKCKKNSQCVFKSNNGFKLGSYNCVCKNTARNSVHVKQNELISYKGLDIEREYWLLKNKKKNIYNESFNCIDCQYYKCCDFKYKVIRNESTNISNDFENENLISHCKQYNNKTLKKIILIVQCAMIIFSAFIGLGVYNFRKHKVVKNSMWILLEIIVIGSIMLYSAVLIQTLEPNDYNCIVYIWLRELGFSTFFSAINLRIYKILTEFQSRKAHCVQLKDKDIIKILCCIIACVIGYLISWTLVDLDYLSQGYSLSTILIEVNGQEFKACKIKWWNHFIALAEFACLTIGIYLHHCTRYAPSELSDRKFMGIVIFFEIIMSIFINIIRNFLLHILQPDILLILNVVQCHLTVTVLIVIMFLSKFYNIFQSNYGENLRNINYSITDELSLNIEISKELLNTNTKENEESEFVAMDIKNDDIRAELKRLYTQLHLQKIMSAKLDNPHFISKIKTNRRIRRCSHTTIKQLIKESDSNNLKTPEESSCSNEAIINNITNSS